MKQLFCIILIFLTGCTALPLPGITPIATATKTSIITSTPPPVITPTISSPKSLRVWLPPQFNPDDDNPAARLLKARLEEFSQRRSGVQIEVRIKSLSGPGGILDSLIAANAAAPLALPDLILLPRATMEAAALKGLLYPYDTQNNTKDNDWYPFSQQLAHLQNIYFGQPFASDALIMVYRSAEINKPPNNWDSTLSAGSPLAFAAAEEQAFFTLAQYLSTSGEIQDNEGRPTLDENSLVKVLTFFQKAEAAGVMPTWLTQLTTDEQVWDAYIKKRSNLAITWTSRYLRELPGDTNAVPIITSQGNLFTLADGWNWVLSSSIVERRSLATELADFLTESDFLAQWTYAAGYLPVRPSALTAWSDSSLRNLIDQIARSAQVIPPGDVLIAIGPTLQEATMTILEKKGDPISTAHEATLRISPP
jgi:multiple sugar transport system substrate-binding protein